MMPTIKKLLKSYLTERLDWHTNDMGYIRNASISNPDFVNAALLHTLCRIADALEASVQAQTRQEEHVPPA